jgi:DNA-binding transcriptional ArsR family regulator
MKPLELLSRYEMTTTRLSARLGLTESTTRWHIARLRKAGLVRIVRWEKSGRQTVPVYGAGSGRDATKPPPIDRIVSRYRYNEKHRARVRLSQRKTPVTPWDVLGITGVTWRQV